MQQRRWQGLRHHAGPLSVVLTTLSAAPAIEIVTVGLKQWPGLSPHLRTAENFRLKFLIHDSKMGFQFGPKENWKRLKAANPSKRHDEMTKILYGPLTTFQHPTIAPRSVQLQRRQNYIMCAPSTRALQNLMREYPYILKPRLDNTEHDPFGVDAIMDCRLGCTNTEETQHFGTHPGLIANLLSEPTWPQIEVALLATLKFGLEFHRSMLSPRPRTFGRWCRILLYCKASKHRCVASAEILLMILRCLGISGQCVHIGSVNGAWGSHHNCGPCATCRGPLIVEKGHLFKLIRQKCDLRAFARIVRPC